MRKQLFVLFNFNKGVFTHILLNVFDLEEKGYEVGVIFESEACKLITEYENVNYDKFDQLKEKQLITAVCEVCAKTMGALDSAKRQNLPIDGRLYGHPPLEEWIKNGFHLMII
ncbi:MAG: cytoplasmic protein [Candidatus Hodarchaeota archaeon]